MAGTAPPLADSSSSTRFMAANTSAPSFSTGMRRWENCAEVAQNSHARWQPRLTARLNEGGLAGVSMIRLGTWLDGTTGCSMGASGSEPSSSRMKRTPSPRQRWSEKGSTSSPTASVPPPPSTVWEVGESSRASSHRRRALRT